MSDETALTVVLRKGADRRLRAGHLWIFSNELEDGFQQFQPGEVVEVHSHGREFLGMGTVNPHSLIAVRLLSHARADIDELFLRERIRAALTLRERAYGPDPQVCRLVFSESDGLPGLIVDRFGDVIVLQSSSAGMDRLQPIIVEVLVEEFAPKAIIAANDVGVRELEGLTLSREIVYGQWEGLKPFELDDIRFLADPVGGQKTGYFLDQRRNREMLGSFVRLRDSVLDLFCYTGGFGLYALKAGAEHVTFVDASASALAIVKEAVTRNGWEGRADYLKADIFPWLKAESTQYDVVVLDPPALAKSRAKASAALRAYRDLNTRAMARVKPGGILATSSCSSLVQPSLWKEAIREAGLKAGRRLRFVAQGGQAPDHPILAAMPETEYLKFLIAVVD